MPSLLLCEAIRRGSRLDFDHVVRNEGRYAVLWESCALIASREEEKMKARAFAFSLVVNIVMNAIISFAISGVDCILASNAISDPALKASVFSPVAFVAPTICGTVIGTLFCMVVPLNDIAEKFAITNGAEPGNPMHNIYKFIVFVLVMVFVESFCCHMILFYLGMNPSFPEGTIATPADWLAPIPSYFIPAYIFAIVFFPVAFGIAAKVSGFDPRKMAEEG